MRKSVTTNPRICAVCFDVDGILVDSERIRYESYRLLLKQFGVTLDLPKYLQIGVGHPRAEVCSWLVDQFRLPISAAALAEARQNQQRMSKPKIVLIPDAVRLLKLCVANLPVGIVSSGTSEWVERVLRKVGVGQKVQCMISADSVELPKPAPNAYLSAANALRMPPDKCVAIEDSSIGISGAKAAGFLCIARPTEFTTLQDMNEADLVVDSLIDPRVIKLLGITCSSRSAVTI